MAAKSASKEVTASRSTKQIKSILPPDEPINVTREQLTLLMMESYKKSSNSAEELMCLREVAKMNGLYEQTGAPTINILNIEKNVQKLESMSDEELLKLSGHNTKLFEQQVNPEPDAIEAQYEEIE